MLREQTVKRLIQINGLITVLDEPRPSDFYFPGESHDFWEGVFVYGGHVTATADERVYQLDPGKLLLHKPMEFHRIWSDGDQLPRFVNISFKASGVGIKRIENGCFDLDKDQQARFWEITSAFKRAMKLLEQAEEERYQLAVNLTAARLEALLIELAEQGPLSHHSQSEDEVRYERIVNVMKENCHRTLSLAELAGLCGLSVSNMKRIFGCFSDVGVAKYFLSLKMRRAMELLDAGMAASQVAEVLDFSETSYFYAVFKRELGMTPSQYRKKRVN